MFDAEIKIEKVKEIIFIDNNGALAKTRVQFKNGSEYFIDADGKITMLYEVHVVNIRTWAQTTIIEYDY